jgi:hypothetical protein
MILPRPGAWSHAAGIFLTWDRIFIKEASSQTTKRTIWCKVRRRYPTWLGFFAKPKEPEPCQHVPLCVEWVYPKKQDDGTFAMERSLMTGGVAAFCGSGTGHYEADGAPCDVVTHICKHCGEVYCELKFYHLTDEHCPHCGKALVVEEHESDQCFNCKKPLGQEEADVPADE